MAQQASTFIIFLTDAGSFWWGVLRFQWTKDFSNCHECMAQDSCALAAGLRHQQKIVDV